MNLQTNVTKEDFKRAYTSCMKAAWILHNLDNFKQAVQWKKDHLFTYNLTQDVEEDSDFESNASTIDVFKVFQEIYEQEDQEKLQQWNQMWTDEQGFDLVEYAGDSIVDGNAVGDLARKYFTYQMEHENLLENSDYTSISFEQYSFKDALKETKNVLENNLKVKYLFEAAFDWENSKLKTRCDVLKLNGNNHVSLFEVKATSKVKKEHFYDLVYQIFILEKNGFVVDEAAIVTLNSEYVYGFKNSFDLSEAGTKRKEELKNLTYEEVIEDIQTNNLLEPFTNELDEDYDLMKVLQINNVFKTKTSRKTGLTEQLTMLEAYQLLNKSLGIEMMLNELAKSLAFKDQRAFKLLNEEFCFSLIDFKWNAKERDFFYPTYLENNQNYCFHALTWFDENRQSIFNLTGLSKKIKAKIYRQTHKVYFDDFQQIDTLNDLDKVKITDKHYRIFETYKKQVKNDLEPKDLIDLNNLQQLKKMLKTYFEHEEIYMFDFETAKWAIPRFKFTKCYQQIPFQYSIDIIHDDNYDYHDKNSMYHHDFLSSKLTDPRPDFIVNFINDMLIKHKKGIYVAYNKAFEQMVLKHLAICFPKYEKPLLYIANNTIDLMDFFKGKKPDKTHDIEGWSWFLVYHPDFKGSYSIKKTQPALDASLSYYDLTINNGAKASQVFREYVDGEIKPKIWESSLYQTMLDYCNRDTLAMVVILKQVDEIVKNYERSL